MTDDYDPDDLDARERLLAREVWAGGDPPLDPLVERADVSPDEAAGLATLLARLDGLRAELTVLLDDARTRYRLPWTLVNSALEGVGATVYFLVHHDPGEDRP